MASRKNGSIKPKGKGKWLIRAYAGKNPRTGRRDYPSKVIKGTRQDAQKALRNLLVEIESGKYHRASDESLSAALDGWLIVRGTSVRKSTLSIYESRAKKVRERLGRLKVKEIKRASILAAYQEWGDRYSHSYMGNIHLALLGAFRYAVDEGWIAPHQNPMDRIKRPKGKPSERVYKPLSVEEMETLLADSEDRQDPLWPLWTLLLTTGLRPSEARALEWRHVDLATGVIRVEQSMSNTGGLRINDVKRPASRRKISLGPKALRGLKAQEKATRLRGGQVFLSPVNGGPLMDWYIAQRWKKALERAGVESRPLYETRHTHATHMLEKDINPKVAAVRMGHASTKMFLDTYSHLTKQAELEGDALEAILYGDDDEPEIRTG